MYKKIFTKIKGVSAMQINFDSPDLLSILIKLNKIKYNIKQSSTTVFRSDVSFYFDEKSKVEFFNLVENFSQAINGG